MAVQTTLASKTVNRAASASGHADFHEAIVGAAQVRDRQRAVLAAWLACLSKHDARKKRRMNERH